VQTTIGALGIEDDELLLCRRQCVKVSGEMQRRKMLLLPRIIDRSNDVLFSPNTGEVVGRWRNIYTGR
jgi:hypothetical protein